MVHKIGQSVKKSKYYNVFYWDNGHEAEMAMKVFDSRFQAEKFIFSLKHEYRVDNVKLEETSEPVIAEQIKRYPSGKFFGGYLYHD